MGGLIEGVIVTRSHAQKNVVQPTTQSHDSTRTHTKMVPNARRKRCEYGTVYTGLFHGPLEIQEVLDGGKRHLVERWPTPIPADARVVMPPVPGDPVYGPAAREECRKMRAEAKRNKINLSRYTELNLRKVIRGEIPLSYAVWNGALRYLRQIMAEREQAKRPMAVNFKGLFAGSGIGLGYRELPPSLPDPAPSRPVRRSRTLPPWNRPKQPKPSQS